MRVVKASTRISATASSARGVEEQTACPLSHDEPRNGHPQMRARCIRIFVESVKGIKSSIRRTHATLRHCRSTTSRVGSESCGIWRMVLGVPNESPQSRHKLEQEGEHAPDSV